MGVEVTVPSGFSVGLVMLWTGFSVGFNERVVIPMGFPVGFFVGFGVMWTSGFLVGLLEGLREGIVVFLRLVGFFEGAFDGDGSPAA